MYIEITNSGEIELESFKLLGASTKREDSHKIGCFGSGIKYSIAYLLRHNLEFKVFSGETEVRFSLKPTQFRDQTFDKILVNDEETSFTTSWGHNWSRWQIFREIVSNALDEGGFSLNKVKSASGTNGVTKIFLKHSDFEKYFDNIQQYFLLGDSCKDGIIEKDSLADLIVYKMGVRVVQESQPEKASAKLPESIFNYNIPSITLNEERIADRWNIEYLSCGILSVCKDKSIIRKLYNLLSSEMNSNTFEYKIMESSSYYSLSEEWLEVIEAEDALLAPKSSMLGLTENRGEKFIRQHNIKSIPDALYTRVKESFGDRFTKHIENIKGISGEFVELKTTKNQEKCIAKSLKLLQEAGMDINYPIKVVSFFKDKEILGMAKDDTIYLADKIFDTGQLLVMSTIIEEYIHLKHKVKDETRQFQDTALNLLANIIYNNISIN